MRTALKAAIAYMLGFLDERASQSSMRLIMLAGVFIPLTVWTWLSLANKRMEVFPETVLVFVGICLGGKTAQKILETRPRTTTVTETTVVPAVQIDVQGRQP